MSKIEPEHVSVTPLSKQSSDKQAALGSRSENFNQQLTEDLLRSIWAPPGLSAERIEQKRKAALDAMQGLEPQNEAEGMLCAQMVSLHFAAMECMKRSMQPDEHIEIIELHLRYADRLMSRFAQHLETLKRMRRTSDQTVRVERVVINGGQAIVGNFKGGQDGKDGKQPRAPCLEHEPGTTLWGEDTERAAVPGACDSR